MRLWPQEGRRRNVHDGSGRGLAGCRSGIYRGGNGVPYRRWSAPRSSVRVLPGAGERAQGTLPQGFISRHSPWSRSPSSPSAPKLSIQETLERMKAAGVDSMPGGGAEIFADHVPPHHLRSQDRWLGVAGDGTAGTQDRPALECDHALRACGERRRPCRSPRPSSGSAGTIQAGFQTFIPLSFHPDNTSLAPHPQDHRHARHQANRHRSPDAG